MSKFANRTTRFDSSLLRKHSYKNFRKWFTEQSQAFATVTDNICMRKVLASIGSAIFRLKRLMNTLTLKEWSILTTTLTKISMSFGIRSRLHFSIWNNTPPFIRGRYHLSSTSKKFLRWTLLKRTLSFSRILWVKYVKSLRDCPKLTTWKTWASFYWTQLPISKKLRSKPSNLSTR